MHHVAEDFGREWIESWNSHDLDRILSHYDADVVLVSPRARSLFRKQDGTVRGREELREYFGLALRRVPDLHFTLNKVYAGVQSVVVNYLSYDRKPACEFMAFGNGGLVSHVIAHYAE